MNGPAGDSPPGASGPDVWAHRLVEAGGLTAGSRVLDVGGGSGALAAAIHAACGAACTVADPGAPDRPGAGVSFVRATAEALPFNAASFEAVLFSHVLHHLADPLAALREAARVAAPGARLLVRAATHADLRALPHAGCMPSLLDGILSVTPDLPDLRAMLTAAGWRYMEARSFHTPQPGTLEAYAESVAMCAWREWAMTPGGGPDPRPAARAWAMRTFSQPPPVAETLILARLAG